MVIVRNRLRKNTQVGKLGETKKSKNLTAMKGGLQKKKTKKVIGAYCQIFLLSGFSFIRKGNIIH